MPITFRGGVGSRCLPICAIVRAVTVTKHEPGVFPLTSCCLVRLTNGLLGPLDDIALSLPAKYLPWCRSSVLTLWLSGAISAAAAKLFFLPPSPLGHDFSFCTVTQRQSRGYVHIMVHRRLACISPPSSLDPRSASGGFVLAKDESSNRFIRDIRPLDSREKSIWRAHLPYYSRLRRVILGKSDTVQITMRSTKDCFYMDEAASHVAIHVIGLRVPQPIAGTMKI